MKQWILSTLALATLATGAALTEGTLANAAYAAPAAAAAPMAANVAAPSLTLEQVFRAESYRGEPAKNAHFSADGRYLAYLWNPFGEPGTDLYVHDTQTGKTVRVTSPAAMAAVETPENLERYARKLQQKRDELAERQAKEEGQAAYLRGEAVDVDQWEHKALEALRVELSERKARDDARKAAEKAAWGDAPAAASAPASAASATAEARKPAKDPKDMELWELRDELKKKLAKEKLKPEDLYPGVSQFVWATHKDELVLSYRGQLLRWKAGSERAEPLLATGRALKPVAYSPDDRALIVQEDTRVLRVQLATAGVEVINRELFNPDDEDRKYKIADTTLSENGRWMALVGEAPQTLADGKAAPKSGRQVEIMNYSDRFATAKKVDREVSDDKRSEPAVAIYIRPVPAVGAQPERQPAPVFTHPGGDVWFELSPVAWAPDGSHYAFATFEREKSLFRVYLGQPGSAPTVVVERRAPIHHELVNVMTPQFTPDSRELVMTLADNGWRQPYAMSLQAGADRTPRPLVKGDFEAYQVLGFTPDAKTMFVVANKDDYAAMNVWRVDRKDGRMTALGQAPEYHRGATVSRDGRWLAAMAGDWAHLPELKLIKGQAPAAGAEPGRVLTQSHDPAWAKVDVLHPVRFSYKNRHGDTLNAYFFKPKGWTAADKRAAIVYTYGGPLNDRHIIETDSFQQTGYMFAMYMAAKHGYVTVAVDPRGHSNYGERFADANFGQPGQPQAEDLEDLVAYMKANLGVDGDRIGLNGWSFGGFQTQYTLYTKPDLFAAGIAGAGPTEWENYNSWYSGRTIGQVDRSKPVLRKYSLLPLARHLKKPLLLVHGMQDPNVLYQDTVNVYRALLQSGKEGLVDLFLDPDGVHALGGAVKPVGQHRKFEAFWLDHLGPAQR